MKRKNKKNGKILLLLLLCVAISGSLVILFQNAHNVTKRIDTKNKKVEVNQNEHCTEDGKKCNVCKQDFFLGYYGKDSVRATLNGTTVTITGVSANLRAVSESTYGEDANGNAIVVSANLPAPDANGTITYTAPADYGGNAFDDITLFFYPANQYKDDDNGIQCDTGDLLWFMTAEHPDAKDYNSVYDDAICVNYRAKYSGNQEMQNRVSYCFEQYVDAAPSVAEVQELITIAEDVYNYRQSLLGNQTELEPDDRETVSDPSTKRTLSCNAYATGEKFDENNELIEFDPSNIKRYNAKKTVYEGTYCKTVCKENVTVSYQAPVATEAGVCFSYKVEIKSKVQCNATSTGVYPEKKSRCVIKSSCWGTYDAGHDQGGPTEDFDSCIEDCDGGKYTQSCINSCYSKTYEEESAESVKRTSNDTLLSYFDNAKIEPVDNVSYQGVTCNDSFTGSKPTYKDANGNYYSANQIYEFRKEYPGGKYVYSSQDRWVWQPEGPCKSAVGYYYYSSLGLTASSVQGFRTIYSSWGGGFKMQNSARFTCDSSCYWYSSGCSSSSLTTPKEVNDDYKAQQQAEKADWEKCKAKAECNTTVTNYTITVDPQDENSLNHKEYEVKQAAGSTPEGDGIMEDYSGHCYSKEDGWEYRNVLSFPRTWISTKNGASTTKKPTNENFFMYVGNTFCPSLSTESVNLDWYDWKVNDNMDLSKLTDDKKAAIDKNRVDNINVRIGGNNSKHLWGLLGWNFEINCFYAALNNPDECTDECCGDCPGTSTTCTGEDCPNPDENQPMPTYNFRAISLKDVFPGNSNEPTGRTPNFNWSCSATNVDNDAYPIQPTATIDAIESKGTSIFNDSNELDYEIELNRSDIKKIKQYNDAHDNYLDFEQSDTGNLVKKSLVTVYKSTLLNQLGDSVKKRGIIGCNNQYGGNCNNEIVVNECYNALK